MTDKLFAICERVMEAQAILHDHLECGQHTLTTAAAR
jgi:hypothetical protein